MKEVKHFRETAIQRRARLNVKRASAQALCSTGDGHAKFAPKKHVTCEACLAMMGKK